MVTIDTSHRASGSNYSSRRGKKPRMIVLHTTETDSLDSAMHELTVGDRKVSAHYLIGRDGQIYQLVDENDSAHHAGDSSWRLVTGEELKDVNQDSIGIEMQHKTGEEFTPEQIRACMALVKDIQQRHGIAPHDVVGHSDIAPERKSDPPANFPWELLQQAGLAANGTRRGANTNAADVSSGYATLQQEAEEYQTGVAARQRREQAEMQMVAAEDAAKKRTQMEEMGEQLGLDFSASGICQMAMKFTSGNTQLFCLGGMLVCEMFGIGNGEDEESADKSGTNNATAEANSGGLTNTLGGAGSLVQNIVDSSPIVQLINDVNTLT